MAVGRREVLLGGLGFAVAAGPRAGFAQDDGLCGAQISQVRRYHHYFSQLEVQKLCGGLVNLAIGFVVTDQFSSKNTVPRQLRMFGHVGHQRNIAV